MKQVIKTLSLLLILFLIACIASTSGCIQSQDQTGENNGQTDSGKISLEKITNINWQWAGVIGPSSENLSIVPNKESYTLIFHTDGTYSITTDCNSGSGNYATDGHNMTIEPGMITLAYCGDESLEPQYLLSLWRITSMTLEDDQLLLSVGNKNEEMLFINANSIDQ